MATVTHTPYLAVLLRTAAILAAIAILLFSSSGVTSALTLQNRSVEISTSIPSAAATYNFQFTYPSTDVVGSVVLLFCDNTALISQPCTAPAGLDVLSATLSSQSGNTGFSISVPDSTANKLVITRAPVAGSMVASSYTFDSVTNPSTTNQTTYARISTYPTTDGTGPYTDNGSVAFSTTSQFAVDVFVPPFLEICVGITVAIDCSSMNGSSINLGILSPQSTKFGTSQFSVGTNSNTGYITSVLGTTMTSGNNTISAINPPASNDIGSNQFGINLRDNTSPNVGQDPQGPGTGIPQAGYNTPNVYKFQNGDTISVSNISTNYTRMTVSYITNINSNQAPGVYTTTMIYNATGQF